MRVERWPGGEVREAALRQRLQHEGYSVYAWTDSAGATYPPHTHDDDQSHWILEGALELTVEGKAYVLSAGDRDWLPAGTRHSARVVGNEPVTYLIAAKRAAAR